MAKDAGTNERIRQQLIQSCSSEPKRFDRAPLPYPKEFDRELDQFIEVVKIAFSGNVPSARQRLSNIVDFCSQVHFISDLAADRVLSIETDTRNLGWGLKQQEKTYDHGRKKDNCKEGQSRKEGS